GVADGQVRDDAGPPLGAEPGEGGSDPAGVRGGAHYSVTPNASATVCMSLSPRPDRLTITISSGLRSAASLTPRWTACDDSSAGMIPSVRQRSWKASSASWSVTGW